MSSATSADEGEVKDRSSVKAKSYAQYNGLGDNRQDRPRSRYDSPPRRERDRSRSPYRAPQGAKRSREEDHEHRSRDSRRFKVHYEDRALEQRRSRISYEDIDGDRASSASAAHGRVERRAEAFVSRSRSRSPFHAERGNRDRGRNTVGSHLYERSGRKDLSEQVIQDQSVSNRDRGPLPTDVTRHEAKHDQGSSLQSENGDSVHNHMIRSQELKHEPELEPEPELDEEAQIELRRKKREALKNKFKGASTPMLVQALHGSTISTPGTPNESTELESTRSGSPAYDPGTPKTPMDIASPDDFSVTDDRDLMNTHADVAEHNDEDGPSAADYDPMMDMNEDMRLKLQNIATTAEGKEDAHSTTVKPTAEVASLTVPASTKKSKDFDMFASDDEDDMFAEDPHVQKPDQIETQAEISDTATTSARELDIGMLDNWDDPEGYYKLHPGELFNGRYHVQEELGRGVYASVVRGTDVTTKAEFAIKIVRNNEIMRKAGLKEIEILRRLQEADPDNKKHVIQLERHFDHKGHLCMVFEMLSMDLRALLKKFGRDVGINLKAVRVYAQQMFLGLAHMKKCNIIHADLKPDNILVNDGKNMLKICDLGTAGDASDFEPAEYLVSRFYRAPEIILGMPYDFGVDVWSIGCTLYEMYTGKILVNGRNNNQALRSIMETRGPFTRKMLNQASAAHKYFDEDMKFLSMDTDRITGRMTVKLMVLARPKRDLRTKLAAAGKGLSAEEQRELGLFTDFLDRCLALNPGKRMTPLEALKHPFLLRPAKYLR